MDTQGNGKGEVKNLSPESGIRPGYRGGRARGPLAEPAGEPGPWRLFDLDQAAAYLGVSPWTVRDLEAAGTTKRVRVPLSNGRELRKLLFDKADLDRLIEVWKT